MASASGNFSSNIAFRNEDSNTTNKFTDQLPESNSSLNHIPNLRFITEKVKNRQNLPFVNIYSVTSEGKGMSAVDISQNLRHLAYSFSYSDEIHLVAQNCLSDVIARNDTGTTWLNFLSARNHLTEDRKRNQENTECLSSPQEYIIRHDGTSGLCFSSDNNLLLSCSLNGPIKIISTTNYCVVEHYDSFGSSADIDVNSDITQFVTANTLASDPFHIAYLYSFERKVPVQHFLGHEKFLKCVRFHPNGLYIATSSSDKSIKLWSVHQSKEVRSFNDGGKPPEKIAFSPDGRYLASSHSGSVKIWDISSGKKLKCLMTSNPEPVILNVCYNLDGSILAAGGSDKKFHIWNITSDSNSEVISDCGLLKSEYLAKTVFSLKYIENFFSCVTG